MIVVLPTHVQPVQGGDMVMVDAMSLQTCKWWLPMQQQLLLEEEPVAPCILLWIPSLLPHPALWKTGVSWSHIYSGHNLFNITFVYHQLQVLWSKPKGKQNWMEDTNNVLLVSYLGNFNKNKPAMSTITQWNEWPQNSRNLLVSNCLKPVFVQCRKLVLVFEVLYCCIILNPVYIFITCSIWYHMQ
jgi:hypothetical protein